jgi:hypothetical protein
MVETRTTCQRFQTPDGRVCVTVTVGDHRETWPVESRQFREWLRTEFREAEGKVANSQAIEAAVATIAAFGRRDGKEFPVAVRCASGPDGAVYLDLGAQDWRAVRVTAAGWDVMEDPPVKFLRTRGLQAIPIPTHGGSLSDLQPFVNVTHEDDWTLLCSVSLSVLGLFRARGGRTWQIGADGEAISTMWIEIA